MNTFVLLGLAAALALFLLRSKRRRAGGLDADPSPSPARAGRGLRRSRRAATPEPVPADHAPSPFASPGPLASPGGFGAVETFAPAEAARSPFPATTAPSDWTPAETIVEPGWPLPGEIAGTWTGGPQASPAPVATVEAPVAHAETAATATHAPPRSSDSWEMPALRPVDPITPEAHPAGDAPADPPAWTPGADDGAPAWPPAQDALPVWSPETPDAPSPPPDAPVVAWAHTEAVVVADEPVAEEPAEREVPLWRPETPAPPADDAVAAPAEPAPVPEWHAPPPEPAPVPEWNAPPPEPAVIAWDAPAPPPAAVVVPDAPALEPFVEVAPAWIPPPAPAVESAPVVDAAPPVAEAPATADLGAQSAEVAHLVPAVLSALRPLVGVSDHVGITPRMLVVVRHLAASPLSVGELAGLLDVSRPVIADIATRLESAGLCHRARDERDRRRVRLVLTGRGRRVCDEAADAPPADAVTDALGRMEPGERDALVRGLRALSRSASA